MKSLEEQMSFYQAYHYHPINKISHFIGIPLIIFSLLLVLSIIRFKFFGFEITVALIFISFVWLYYVKLDTIYAAVILVPIISLLYLADRFSNNANAMWIFAVSFVVGWIFQLIGHIFEGRKPALLDNFFQIFIAPLFLVAELFFFFNFRKNQQSMLLKLSERYRR